MVSSKEIIEQYNIISKNIKFYRNKANLSQEQLAELADLSISYIKQLESGKIFKNITLTTLLKLSKALNINVNKLFYKTKNTHSPGATSTVPAATVSPSITGISSFSPRIKDFPFKYIIGERIFLLPFKV